MTTLADVLCLDRREMKPVPEASYPMLGIYSHGKGTFHKQPILGMNAPQAGLYQVKTGDLVLNITFAWEGAVAVVNEEDDGWFVSGRFPTFTVNPNRCDVKFLKYYYRTRSGLDQLGTPKYLFIPSASRDVGDVNEPLVQVG